MRTLPRTSLLILGLVAGCKLSTTPVTNPMCLAQDAFGREVQCSPPPQSYEGDRCTCMLANTREVFVGRVRDVGQK